MARIWLDVPYDEKDKAKAAGARWDSSVRRWYAPHGGITGLAKWRALPPVPNLLPGEDRNFGSGLFVDMVPQSCWFTNVRTCVGKRDWERIRWMVTSRADNRCEVCGARPDRSKEISMETHERWSYDVGQKVQTLRRLICLCTSCHTVTHYGLAQIKGLKAVAFAHLMKVNGWNKITTQVQISDAFDLWKLRSSVTWSLDLSILIDAGVTLKQPPDASGRRDVANMKTQTVRHQEHLQK